MLFRSNLNELPLEHGISKGGSDTGIQFRYRDRGAKLAGTLNDNTQIIESTLDRLPDRYTALTRTASFGSWFNFFLCDFDGRVGVGQGVSQPVPTFSSGAARCQR